MSVVEFHPEAALEALEAHAFYVERSEKAAARFLAELDHAVENIAEFPDRYASHTHGTRVYLLRRFPYLVIYLESTDIVNIVAVAHGHRRPGYWKSRVKP